MRGFLQNNYQNQCLPPRLNSSHLAMAGGFKALRMACIAGPSGGYYDLLNGGVSTVAGGGAQAVQVVYAGGTLGSANAPTGNTANLGNIGFTAPVAGETVTRMTLACIFKPTVINIGNGVVNNGADINGPSLKWNLGGSGLLNWAAAGSTLGTALQCIVNHDYFVVGSWIAGIAPATHEFMLDMTTGRAIATVFAQGGASQVSGNQYGVISYDAAAGGSGVVQVAAAFASVYPMSVQDLIAWGADPWALWYG
jgi:hypothetical protein